MKFVYLMCNHTLMSCNRVLFILHLFLSEHSSHDSNHFEISISFQDFIDTNLQKLWLQVRHQMFSVFTLILILIWTRYESHDRTRPAAAGFLWETNWFQTSTVMEYWTGLQSADSHSSWQLIAGQTSVNSRRRKQSTTSGFLVKILLFKKEN